MKTHLKPHHRVAPSVRVQPGAVAMLLTLILAASVAFDAKTFAQSKRKPTRRPGPQNKPQLRDFEFDTVTVNSRGAITSRRKGHARYYTEMINGVALEMVSIPEGSFTMGSREDHNESPAHQVSLPAFNIGKYEVTQAQWRAVARLPKVNRDLNPDPSNFKGANLPVEQVGWFSAMEFCARLYKATGRVYRLPSEAEWEYACRAGTTTPFAFGETITPEIANYNGNAPYGSAPKGMLRKHTTPVGSFGVANGFGLYDMHGNVQEWCLDYYHSGYDGAPTDGSVWEDRGKTLIADETDRMARGGDWDYTAERCRSFHRSHYLAPNGIPGHSGSNLGFRVVSTSRSGAATSSEDRVKPPSAGENGNDLELKHDWRIEEGKNGVNYTSRYPAPPPFSYNQEPEATIAVESVKASRNQSSLSKVVGSEIRDIRRGLQIAEYLEDDGHKPVRNIASWLEEIDGQQVAFIKYRVAGIKGEQRILPRTIRHAILIRNGKLYLVHLTVIFAKRQEEVRADQIRLIKAIIRK